MWALRVVCARSFLLLFTVLGACHVAPMTRDARSRHFRQKHIMDLAHIHSKKVIASRWLPDDSRGLPDDSRCLQDDSQMTPEISQIPTDESQITSDDSRCLDAVKRIGLEKYFFGGRAAFRMQLQSMAVPCALTGSIPYPPTKSTF